MNILILSENKSEKDTIKDLKNNNIYLLNKAEFSYRNIKKLKEEKDIQIIVNRNKDSFLLKMYSHFLGIPIVNFKELENNLDVEKLLQRKLAYKNRKDLPVLMYHRVIDSEEEKGTYDTYVTKENFEEQMKYLKENNYESLTFKDIQNGEYKKRFDKDKKYVIITFDDGYKECFTYFKKI